MKKMFKCAFAFLICSAIGPAFAQTNRTTPEPAPVENVQAEHDAIGNTVMTKAPRHTMHPDAQWYGDAGLGLFIHWGIASVKGINISWSMIDGLDGKPAQITPNDYFALAKDFNPTNYHPDKWLKAAKHAGFIYAVLTTRHHEGFALWPSAYGDFSTKNYLGGRDLVRDYVEACRKNGLKVGLYYSPPDWYFERDTKNFSRVPGRDLGPDGKPRTTKPTPEQKAAQKKAYIALVRGQIIELLTRYGKIDLLWFDGRVPGVTGDEIITLDEIRKLQPGIVVDGRLHGKGDFITYERKLDTGKPVIGWAEFCNPWTAFWPYVIGAKYRANGFVLGQFVACRALHVNYLLDVGPKSDGTLEDEVYTNMTVVANWMEANGESVHGIMPLPDGEGASVPATARSKSAGSAAAEVRYLFALPRFRGEQGNETDINHVYPEDILPPQNVVLSLTNGLGNPTAAILLRDHSQLHFTCTNRVTTVQLPASKRTDLVDVVKLEYPPR
ncbi:MAG TPA: alpha-L-fucosidase [Verrucomicrobiae bacterium]|nr:alpha-L-fucosidase [Verrucomicrobiae bacterium]